MYPRLARRGVRLRILWAAASLDAYDAASATDGLRSRLENSACGTLRTVLHIVVLVLCHVLHSISTVRVRTQNTDYPSLFICQWSCKICQAYARHMLAYASISSASTDWRRLACKRPRKHSNKLAHFCLCPDIRGIDHSVYFLPLAELF